MNEIKKINIEDPEYPQLLKLIKDPPKILYFIGELKPQEKCLAIVGTRKCSPYGIRATQDFANKLSEANLTIVSGLASGIDTVAHQTCVDNKKRTIAVLGTGLDEQSIYPKENIGLAKKILENNGCLISELPPGTPGARYTFPRRNRIISGLSQAVLIIEAKTKSGALITADYAKEQKRKLFAVPGSIYSANSTGTNRLIRAGAKLVDNPDDILQELDLLSQNQEISPGQGRLIIDIK